jgi:DNA-binding response OmpR family regulator
MTRILVVDDSITHSRYVVNTLSDMGYIFEFATDGEDALLKCAVNNYDLVIMDIVMPGKNGFQLCRALRSDLRYRSSPIIMLSGKGLDIDRVWGLRQGADEYLTKPCNPLVLVEAVTRLLAERQHVSASAC